MVGIQVFKRGKWIPVAGLFAIKRGNAYRLKTGPNSWGEPRLAQSDAKRTMHPLHKGILVWEVDGLMETVRR